MYTFDWTHEQLMLAHDYVNRTGSIHKIIHVLYEDSTDHYIALVSCDTPTAVFLALL